jgi:SAM-dependent methyltransferase
MLLKEYYEKHLHAHGDSHLGVNWPNLKDAIRRYQVMLDIIPKNMEPISLMDIGCGAGHFYDFLNSIPNGRCIKYSGIDISSNFTELCKQKYPNVDFYCSDILRDSPVPLQDYFILNGVFTVKSTLPYDAMFEFMKTMLIKLWSQTRKGIAFNVMSSHVEWERTDLFHVPFDSMAKFIRSELSRHFLFRQDYGLYEYTTYIYKDSSTWEQS